MATVFISYRHETPEHQALVFDFAERLRNDGISVVFDKFLPPGGPGEGWNRWSERQVSFVEQVDRPPKAPGKILIIASVGWFSVYQGSDGDPLTGFGSACEALVIQDLLMRWKMNRKDAPVRIVSFGSVLSGEIPPGLRDLPRFDVLRPEQYGDLVKWIGATLLNPPPLSPWPEEPPALEPWPLTSGEEARVTCAAMLTSTARQRVLRLLVSGHAEDSQMTVQLYQCASNLKGKGGMDIRTARLDLKGGTSLGLELEEFARSLGCKEIIHEHLNLKELDQLRKIFTKLEQQQVPTLLIFDNIERGADFRDWIIKIALPEIARVEWLRLITSGRDAPDPAGAPWGRFAGEPLSLGKIFTAESAENRRGLEKKDSLRLSAFSAVTAEGLLQRIDRAGLRAAFIAAAVPHWCDPPFLAALLNLEQSAAANLLDELRSLPEVESFAARGREAINLTEPTRADLRRHLAQEDPDLLKLLSARAAAFLAGHNTRTFRMERIYHRLVAEGNASADDAEALDMEFWQGLGSAEHAIYAGMLRELTEEGSIHGRALVEALLSAGFSASKLAQSYQARTLARRAREVARHGANVAVDVSGRALYLWGVARTHCIEAEIAEEEQKNDSAKQSYAHFLATMEEATALLPDHLRLREQEAVAASRLGNCCEPDEALPHYRNARALLETIVAAKPGDDVIQRECSMMDHVEGNAHLKLGHATEALKFLHRFVIACRERAQKDESNVLWAADLAEGLRQLGDAQQLAAQTSGALETFREGLDAARRSVELDPMAGGQVSGAHDTISTLQIAEGRLFNVLLPLAEFSEARKLCRQHFSNCKASADADPENLKTQFRLGVAHYYNGELQRCQGQFFAALPCYEEARTIYQNLVAKIPDLDWRRELGRVQGVIGTCQKTLGRESEARESFENQLAVCEELEAEKPGDYGTRSQMVWAHLYLGSFAAEDSKLGTAKIHYEAALHLARELAEDQENADAQRTLAQALLCVGGFRVLEEQDLDALAATQQACKIYRKLVEKAPKDIGRQSELASAHLQLAGFLEKRGDLVPAAENRKIAAELYDQQFNTLAKEGLTDLAAISAAEQSAVLAAREGNLERAITLFRMLLTQTTQFSEKPGNQSLEAPRKKLGELHHNLADLLVLKQELGEAASHYQLALAGWEAFQKQQPERAEWQHLAANVHARLADLDVLRQAFPEAESEFTAAIAGLEASWKRTSANPFWRQNLVIARYRHAAMLAQIGRESDALSELEACRGHLEYVDQLPDQGSQIKRYLIELESLTGDVLMRMGRSEEAIDAYFRALERAERLEVSIKPPDEKIRGQRSAMEARLGSACLGAGRFGEARVFLKNRQAFCEDELEKKPDRAWEREVAWVFCQLSSIRWQLGETNESLALQLAAFEILNRITELPPENQTWLSDLAHTCNFISVLLQRTGDLPGAILHGRRAVEIATRLAALAPEIVSYLLNLDRYQKNLDIYLGNASTS